MTRTEKFRDYITTEKEEYVRILHTDCKIRFFGLSITLVFVYLMFLYGKSIPVKFEPAILMAFLILAYNFVFYLFSTKIIIESRAFYAILLYLSNILDVGGLCVLIYITGGITKSPFIMLPYVTIIVKMFYMDVLSCIFNSIITLAPFIIMLKFTGDPEYSSTYRFIIYGTIAMLFMVNLITFLLRKEKNNSQKLLRENAILYDELRSFNSELESRIRTATSMLVEVNTQLKSKIMELSALDRVGKVIVSELDLDHLVNVIIENVSELLSVDTCLLAIDKKRDGKFVWAGHRGLEGRQLSKIFETAPDTIISSVLKSGKTMICNTTEDFTNNRIDMETWNENSIIGIPLFCKDKIIAILVASNKNSKRTFTSHDIEILTTVASESAVALENAWLYENMQENYYNTIKALTRVIEARDPFLQGHSERVSNYAILIAKKMSLPLTDVEQVQFGAILHDIGKIGINERLLNKPGKLTPDEYEEVLRHTVIGEQIISPIKDFEIFRPLVRWHHKRHDMHSEDLYGITSKRQLVLCDILTVSDAFDAMTSERPYRKRALTIDEAIDELIKERGKRYNPEIVDIALSVFADLKKI